MPSLFEAILLLVETESLVEAVYASAGVNQLLLTCVEGVALGADFYSDVALGGAGFDNIAASTGDGSRYIIRMDTFLSHC